MLLERVLIEYNEGCVLVRDIDPHGVSQRTRNDIPCDTIFPGRYLICVSNGNHQLKEVTVVVSDIDLHTLTIQ